MKYQTDIAIYNKSGQLVLVAEAKNKLNTTNRWAAEMRRNMLAHGLMPEARYFLLALPDRFYLWKDAGIEPEIVPPTYEADPKPILQPHYLGTDLSLDDLTGENFELVISSWLSNLLLVGTLPAELADQDWLVESGLFETIRFGQLAAQAAV